MGLGRWCRDQLTQILHRYSIDIPINHRYSIDPINHRYSIDIAINHRYSIDIPLRFLTQMTCFWNRSTSVPVHGSPARAAVGNFYELRTARRLHTVRCPPEGIHRLGVQDLLRLWWTLAWKNPHPPCFWWEKYGKLRKTRFFGAVFKLANCDSHYHFGHRQGGQGG